MGMMDAIALGKEKYEDDKDCPICKLIMVEPVKFISCVHVFCRQCALKMVRHLNTSCPICRTYSDQKPVIREKKVKGKSVPFMDFEHFSPSVKLQKKIKLYFPDEFKDRKR